MRRFLVAALLLLNLDIKAATDFVSEVRATNGTGRLVVPTNFFQANLIAGTNIVLEKTNRTGLIIHANVGGGGGGSGEANVNGEVSVTNATRLGLVAGKAGVTNFLRSVQAGIGLVFTNQGTNIMFAIDQSIVVTQANLTTASNALRAFAATLTDGGLAGEVAFADGLGGLSFDTGNFTYDDVGGRLTVGILTGTTFEGGSFYGNGLGLTNLPTSLTNSTKFDPRAGKYGLKTLSGGNGIVLTNVAGTNLAIGIDPAVVLTTVSNAVAVSAFSNGVAIVYRMTNLNFVDGSGLKSQSTNASGNVSIQPRIDWLQAVSVTNLIGVSNNVFSAGINQAVPYYVTSTKSFAYNSGFKFDPALSLVYAPAIQVAGAIVGSSFLGGFALYSDGGLAISESTTSDTELGYLTGVTGPVQAQFSNDVRVVGGVGITVTPSGSGGIMTYSVAGIGAAGNLTTNANQFLGVPLSIKTAPLFTNVSSFGTVTNRHSANYVHYDINSASPADLKIWTQTIQTNGQQFSELSDDGLSTHGYDLISRPVFGTVYRSFGYQSNIFSGDVYLPAPAGAATNLALTSGGLIVGVPASSIGGNLQTNANQFAANLVLNIKSGALLTNIQIRSAAGGASVPLQIYSRGGQDADLFQVLDFESNSIAWVTADGDLKLQGAPGISASPRFYLNSTNGNSGVNFRVPVQASATNSFLLDFGVFSPGQVISAHGISGQTVTLTNSTVSSSSGVTSNANQFLGVPLTIKSGVLLTNAQLSGSNYVFQLGAGGASFGLGDANPVTIDPGNGFIDIGSGETVVSPGRLVLNQAAPLGIQIINSDFHITQPVWHVDGSGNLTNRGWAHIVGAQTNDATLKVIGPLIPAQATASRAAIINAQGVLTNASGTPDGTKFLRDDGAYAVPAGTGEVNVNGEISVTNATRFGLVAGKAGITNLVKSVQPAYGLKGTNESGTNVSLAIDPAIVASQSDLTGASNVLRTAFVANDTTTSNGVVTLLVANDTTTSNALRTLLIANDTTTSNGVVTLLVANDTTTSNALRTLLIANDTTTSNGVVALVGETNWNGEVSVTNSTRIGWVNGKSNNTNLIRSAQGGNGILLTNQGTNVMFAIDPSIVPTQTQLNTASNTVFSAIPANTTNNIVRETAFGNTTTRAVNVATLHYASDGNLYVGVSSNNGVALITYNLGTNLSVIGSLNFNYVATNGVPFGAVTQMNFVNGITGYVANGKANLGVSVSGGGASPGGASGDVQFNDGAGGFGADSGFIYDIGSQILTVLNVTIPSGQLTLGSTVIAEDVPGVLFDLTAGTLTALGEGRFQAITVTNGGYISNAILDRAIATNLTVYTGSPGLTLIPKVGTATNTIQVLTTNLVPIVSVNSNGVVTIGTNVSGSFSISNNVGLGITSLKTANTTASAIYQNATGVGIGTVPGYPLDVAGNARFSTDVYLERGGGGTYIGSLSAVNVRFGVNSAVVMTLDTSQRVGIGTATPAALLDVAGTANSYLLRVNTNVLVVTNGSVRIGPSGGAITNILTASATLDFPSTAAGAVSDLPITLTGAADGDVVSLGVPSGSITTLTGTYLAWASNGVAYVRFINNNLVTAQDPASGTYRIVCTKF